MYSKTVIGLLIGEVCLFVSRLNAVQKRRANNGTKQ